VACGPYLTPAPGARRGADARIGQLGHDLTASLVDGWFESLVSGYAFLLVAVEQPGPAPRRDGGRCRGPDPAQDLVPPRRSGLTRSTLLKGASAGRTLDHGTVLAVRQLPASTATSVMGAPFCGGSGGPPDRRPIGYPQGGPVTAPTWVRRGRPVGDHASACAGYAAMPTRDLRTIAGIADDPAPAASRVGSSSKRAIGEYHRTLEARPRYRHANLDRSPHSHRVMAAISATMPERPPGRPRT